jgi:hypothetical protein
MSQRLIGLSTAFVVLAVWGPCPATSADGETSADTRRQVPHAIVRITGPDANHPAEVSVAIDPTNLQHIVAVSHQRSREKRPSSNYAYITWDGGRSWISSVTPNPDGRAQGDDAVVFGPDGTVYHAYLSALGYGQPRPRRADSGLFIQALRPGGEESAPVAIVNHLNTVEPMEDKPWPAVDHSPESKYYGSIYVSWTRFEIYGSKDPAHKSHIYFARSRDGGRSFAPVFRISDKPGSCRDDSSTVEGAMPAVGPKGEVYVVWAGPEGLIFKKSTDGGVKFSKEKLIGKMPGGWDSPAPGVPRHNGMPVTMVDVSSGPNRGTIYVNWIDKRNGDLDVFLASSRDGGETWNEPVRVNDDPKGSDQLFTWMAVDPADGSINLVFYDRRNLKDTMTGLTLARSVDGGKSFVNYRIDQQPFACQKDVFMGDYIGISAVGGRVVAAYCHLLEKKQTTLSAAVFQFKLGTQEATLPIIASVAATAQLGSDVHGLESSLDFPCCCRRFGIRLRIAPRCFLGRRP